MNMTTKYHQQKAVIYYEDLSARSFMNIRKRKGPIEQNPLYSYIKETYIHIKKNRI